MPSFFDSSTPLLAPWPLGIPFPENSPLPRTSTGTSGTLQNPRPNQLLLLYVPKPLDEGALAWQAGPMRVYWPGQAPMSANRTIVLIHPRVNRRWSTQPWCDLALELICVGSPLARKGYRVRIIDQRVQGDWRERLLSALAEKPLCVGVTSDGRALLQRGTSFVPRRMGAGTARAATVERIFQRSSALSALGA